MKATEVSAEDLDTLAKTISQLRFYYSIKDDVERLIGLVQENQVFFGNPPAGQSCIKLATDKLEKMINKQ